jgi:serine O-acetyltransferase
MIDLPRKGRYKETSGEIMTSAYGNSGRLELAGMDALVAGLARPASYQIPFRAGLKMPSLEALGELMLRLRAVFFPGFYSQPYASDLSLSYHLSANLDSIFRILAAQIECGYCFSRREFENCSQRGPDAADLASRFMHELPEIRARLEGDVLAAYEGDPAAKSPGETVFCYPSIQVMTNHRVAHELYRLDVPLIPRIISEMAHSATGIDIHPGASIGRNFFIDHGTGVVIGETCVIGENCRLYQGVTLGALSFPKEEDGVLSKGLPRHPILEDNVVVYSGATILGRVTIGAGSLIGGNVWITRNVAPGSQVVQQRSTAALPGDDMLGRNP